MFLFLSSSDGNPGTHCSAASAPSLTISAAQLRMSLRSFGHVVMKARIDSVGLATLELITCALLGMRNVGAEGPMRSSSKPC